MSGSPPRSDASHVDFAFFRDGRLVAMPARRRLRLVALERLAARFEPGRRYPEREVNRLLADDAPDHATLRRLLVDEALLRRQAGEYWRAEGVIPVRKSYARPHRGS